MDKMIKKNERERERKTERELERQGKCVLLCWDVRVTRFRVGMSSGWHTSQAAVPMSSCGIQPVVLLQLGDT